MAARGLIAGDPARITGPTAARLGPLRERVRALTESLVEGLPGEDLGATRRVLAAITDRAARLLPPAPA